MLDRLKQLIVQIKNDNQEPVPAIQNIMGGNESAGVQGLAELLGDEGRVWTATAYAQLANAGRVSLEHTDLAVNQIADRANLVDLYQALTPRPLRGSIFSAVKMGFNHRKTEIEIKRLLKNRS